MFDFFKPREGIQGVQELPTKPFVTGNTVEIFGMESQLAGELPPRSPLKGDWDPINTHYIRCIWGFPRIAYRNLLDSF